MTLPLAATGEKSGAVGRRRPRLVASTVPVASLDPATVGEAFALFRLYYDGVERGRFEKDLAEKQRIILLRDAATGALKGFSTVLIQAAADPGSPGGPAGTVVFSGDTVIDREYWGQKQLQVAFAKLLFSLKFRSPRRPLYWFLISKGYRTYLLLANSFPLAVPRCDRPDDPALGRLLDRLATRRYGRQYDPASRLIRLEQDHDWVREGAAPVTDQLLRNAHIRFFVERNPGHGRGDELACLARVRLRDLAAALARIGLGLVRRAFGAAPRGSA